MDELVVPDRAEEGDVVEAPSSDGDEGPEPVQEEAELDEDEEAPVEVGPPAEREPPDRRGGEEGRRVEEELVEVPRPAIGDEAGQVPRGAEDREDEEVREDENVDEAEARQATWPAGSPPPR